MTATLTGSDCKIDAKVVPQFWGPGGIERIHHLVRAFGSQAFAYQSAYYLEGYTGAALWLPPKIHPEEDALNALVQDTLSGPMQKDVFAILEQMSYARFEVSRQRSSPTVTLNRQAGQRAGSG